MIVGILIVGILIPTRYSTITVVLFGNPITSIWQSYQYQLQHFWKSHQHLYQNRSNMICDNKILILCCTLSLLPHSSNIIRCWSGLFCSSLGTRIPSWTVCRECLVDSDCDAKCGKGDFTFYFFRIIFKW